MTQSQEGRGANPSGNAPVANRDVATTSPPDQLSQSSAENAASFALLAVPSHPPARSQVEITANDCEAAGRPRDPISEAGWLAAVDAILMGGLLNDW